MAKFRKKPVVIEAVQWTGDNLAELENFMDRWIDRTLEVEYGNQIVVRTLEGNMRAHVSDWIIRGVQGEFYPCKADIFAATYEAAE